MIEFVKVSRIKALDGARIWGLFSNGMEGIRDCSDILSEGGSMVEPLRDPQMFKRVLVQCGVPAWPNGFDIDAIQLYMEMKEAGGLKPEAAPLEQSLQS
ncbi:MAG: DUF2442 domain-containing protein [Rhodomicrobium sp.]